jgi:hypothetical protein
MEISKKQIAKIATFARDCRANAHQIAEVIEVENLRSKARALNRKAKTRYGYVLDEIARENESQNNVRVL